MDVRTEIRISDDEREAMSARLGTAFVEGRLDVDELEERLAAVVRAITPSELEAVAADLPPPARIAPRPQPSPRQHRPPPTFWPFYRRIGLLDLVVALTAPVLALMLLVAISSGIYLWPAWVWIACAAPTIVWVLPSRRRRR